MNNLKVQSTMEIENIKQPSDSDQIHFSHTLFPLSLQEKNRNISMLLEDVPIISRNCHFFFKCICNTGVESSGSRGHTGLGVNSALSLPYCVTTVKLFHISEL